MEMPNPIDLLHVALANSDERIKAVIDFQSLMFKSDGLLVSEEIDEVLHELAGDLEFYVPGDSQDPSYFDDAKAKKLIREALARIENSASREMTTC